MDISKLVILILLLVFPLAVVSCSAGQYSYFCWPCPSGSYCVNNNKHDCDPGTYQSLTGQSSCNRCDMGTYSVSGSTSCSNCLSGSYCVNGIRYGCAVGTALSSMGATSASACVVCGLGTYSDSVGSSSCSICPIGSYCLNGIKKACSSGTFQSLTGQSSCNACSTPLATNYTTSICTSTANTVTSACSNPIAGFYTTAICIAGTALTLGSNTMNQACAVASNGYTILSLCLIGSYSSLGKNTAFVCSNGYYGSPIITGSTSLSNCMVCSIGSSCSSGIQTICTSSDFICSSTTNALTKACANPTIGYVIDKNCSQGNITVVGSQTTFVCDKAYGGVAQVIGAVISGCSICLEGTFKSSTGNLPCQLCPFNFFSTIGATNCSICLNGYCNSTSVEANKSFSYNLNTCGVSTFPILKSVKASSTDQLSKFIVSYSYLNEGVINAIALSPSSSNTYDSSITQTMFLSNPSSQINVTFACLNTVAPCSIDFDVDFNCVEVGYWTRNELIFNCGSQIGKLSRFCSKLYCDLAVVPNFNFVPEIASCGNQTTYPAFKQTENNTDGISKVLDDSIYDALQSIVISYDMNATNKIVNLFKSYFDKFVPGFIKILMNDTKAIFDALQPEISRLMSNITNYDVILRQISLGNQDISSSFFTYVKEALNFAKNGSDVIKDLVELGFCEVNPWCTHKSDLEAKLKTDFETSISQAIKSAINPVMSAIEPILDTIIEDNLDQIVHFLYDELPISRIYSINKNLIHYFNDYFVKSLSSNWTYFKESSNFTPEVTWLVNGTTLYWVNFMKGTKDFYSSPAIKDFYINNSLIIKPQRECSINYTHSITSIQVKSHFLTTLFQVFTYLKNNKTTDRLPMLNGGYTSINTNEYSFSNLLGPGSEISVEIICTDFSPCVIDYEIVFTCLLVGEWIESLDYGPCSVQCGNGTMSKEWLCNSDYCDMSMKPNPTSITFCNAHSCSVANNVGSDKPCFFSNFLAGTLIPCNSSLNPNTDEYLFPIEGCMEYEKISTAENFVSVLSDHSGNSLGKHCDLLDPKLYGNCYSTQPAPIALSPLWQSIYAGFFNESAYAFVDAGVLPRICNCTINAILADSCGTCDFENGWILSGTTPSTCIQSNGSCSTPRDGFFVTETCNTKNGVIIKDTQIKACLQPATYQYVTSICRKGDAFTLGNNTEFAFCNKDVIPQPYNDPSLAAVSGLGFVIDIFVNSFVYQINGENSCFSGSAYQLGHRSYSATMCSYSNGALVAGNILCSQKEIPMLIPPNIHYRFKYLVSQKPDNPTYAFMDCPSPAIGETFTFYPCLTGDPNKDIRGTPTSLVSCRYPNQGEYVSKECQSGGIYKVGSDTILSRCTSPSDGFYVQNICQNGIPSKNGTDTNIARCSSPSSSQYVISTCKYGAIDVLGKDTQFGDCLSLLPHGVQNLAAGLSSYYISSPCNSGNYSTPGSQTQFSQCSDVGRGYFQISPCQNGKNVVQQICPLGFSCSGLTKTKNSCTYGTYSDTLGAIMCNPCGDFMTTLSTSSTNSSDCVCVSKYYLNSEGICIPCKEGLNCDDGQKGNMEINMQAQDGSYLSVSVVNGTKSYVGIQCEPKSACANNTCAVGYEISSFLCSSCEKEYYRSGSLQNPSNCYPCKLTENHFIYYGYLSMTFILASLIIAFLVYNSLKKSKKIVRKATSLSNDAKDEEKEGKNFQYSVLTRVTLSQFQLLGLISDFRFSWPSIPKMTMDVGAGVASSSLITNNFAIQSSIKCLLYYPGVPEPVNNLLVVLYTFIICISIVCLFWTIRSLVKTGGLIFNDPDRILKLKLSLIALCYMSYGKIFASTIQLFACKSFNGDRLGNIQRLEGAYDIVCLSPEHMSWIYKLVLPVFVFIVILFPLYALCILIGKGEERNQDQDFLRTYGFLYFGYNEKHWWYEWVSLLRKLSISFIIIFMPSSTDTQVYQQSLLALFVLGIYLASMLVLSPYKDSSMTQLESIALGVAILTFYLGLWTIGNTSATIKTLVTVLFFTVNGVWFLSVFRLFFKEFLLSKYLTFICCKRRANNTNNNNNNNKIIEEKQVELSSVSNKDDMTDLSSKIDDSSTIVMNPLNKIKESKSKNKINVKN